MKEIKSVRNNNDTKVLIKKGLGPSILSTITKTAATGVIVYAGYKGGEYLSDIVLDNTDNASLGLVAKYGTPALASLLSVGIVNPMIDKIGYEKSSISDIKNIAIEEKCAEQFNDMAAIMKNQQNIMS